MNRLVIALAVLVLPAASASAQTPRPRSFEASFGAIALGPVDFGSNRASLIGNQTSAPEVTFFNTDTELGAGTGFDGRLAFNVTRSLAVEAGFVWTRATLESRITSDVESIPSVTVVQDLDTYFVEGSAVWHLNRWSFAGRRALPFVAGGIGYLRQLDDEALLSDDPGAVYHAGGGVKVLFHQSPRGFIRGLGVRADARMYFLTSGVELDDSRDYQTRWAVAGSALVRF
jgi:opacity protein-like surface antigen